MAVKKLSNDVLGELQSSLDNQTSFCLNHIKRTEGNIKTEGKSWVEKHGKPYLRELKKDLQQAKIDFERHKDIFLSEDTKTKPKNVSDYYESEFSYSKLKGSIYVFQNARYEVKGTYTDEEKSLLVQAEADKERIKFEKLKRKFELANSTEVTEATGKPKRRQIPESVRIAVWRRDQGTCVKCGSRERLEYDHIIPVVEGGGDTVRNIELLCESCNRSKGAKIQ